MTPFMFVAGAGLWVAAVAGLILFFGDPDSNSLLGRAARLVGVTVPAGVWRVATVLRLTWLLRAPGAAVHWFLYTPHPVIQIAYVLLVAGLYTVFVIEGYPLMPNRYMAGYHKAVGAAVFVGCAITFILASFKDPGVVTRANAATMARAYPYDNFMYTEGRVCETCGTPRIARAKHSRVTDRCVARFDHYCIWLANDVGANNYRWFLAFLVCNTTLLVYGTIACLAILADEMVSKDLRRANFINQATGQSIPSSWGIIFQYFMFHFSSIMMVLLIAGVMSLVMVGFTCYHLYLTATNVTTNETFKWREAVWAHDAAAKEAAAEGKGPVEPVPRNAYHKGVIANYREIVRPPPLYTPAVAAAAEPAAAAAGGGRGKDGGKDKHQ